jgi:hypothetical protein
VYPALLSQAGIELGHRLHDAQPGPHRPLRIVFVRPGVAEVDEQTVTEILGDMPLKAGDHLSARLLIRPHHLAPLLRVELAGQHRGVDEIAEQHRELAALGIGRTRFSW